VTKRIFFGDALPAMRYINLPVVKNEPFTVYGGRDGVSYSWDPPTGLSSANSKISNGILSQSQQFIVHVVNNFGCGRYDTLLVSVINDCKVFVPSVFSPNNDGINDKIRAYFGCLKTLNYFNIYNRWGRIVFSTSSPTEGWNGKIGDIDQESSTYVWVASGEFLSGEKFIKKGSFVLMR
jgi:gliding motility-associated-like protein